MEITIPSREQGWNLWQSRDFSSACWLLPVSLTVSEDFASSIFVFVFEPLCDTHYEVSVI